MPIPSDEPSTGESSESDGSPDASTDGGSGSSGGGDGGGDGEATGTSDDGGSSSDSSHVGGTGCSNGALHFGPVAIPDGVVGEPYFAELERFADDGWNGVAYLLASDLPPGLVFDDSSPALSGTPEQAGSFTIVIEAGHPESECATAPDPHTFTLDIVDGS